jgi:PncC family amidohydrolase
MDEEAQAIAARLVRRLKEYGAILTVAESCTGGLLASTFTDIAGASQWFTQSWVTYSNESKTKELEVEADLLSKKGAVNATVAIQMAEGARKRSGADFSISITGIAGPKKDSSEKPIGLVYVGIATKHWANAESIQMGGNRHENKRAFVQFALRTAIDCWDNAKVRKKEAVAKEVLAREEKERAETLMQQEKDRINAEATQKAPWQDDSWKSDDADSKLDVDWSEE